MFRTLPRQRFLYLVPGMLLVLALAGYYLDRLVDDQLIAYFDTTLDAKARSIVAAGALMRTDASEPVGKARPELQYFDHELPDGRSGRWLAVS